MKNKKLKYILIFVFIVCLLIPISCINIFAVNYTAYTYYYHSSISSSQAYDDNATFENWEKIIIDNTEYINNGQYSTLYINVRTRTNYSISFNIYARNINTSSYNYFLEISSYNLKNTYNYMYLDKIQIYYNDNTYLHIYSSYSNNASLSGYGTRLVYNHDYYVKDYFSDNDYYYIQSYYGSSLYYTYKFDVKFILASPSVISFDKTYNLTFYNNDTLYNSITISGASSSGYAPFQEISQIKYGNTIVYDNSTWSSGYNSTLRYNQLMTQPDVTTINNDCNSIITFTTQSYIAIEQSIQIFNIGTFYNDSGGGTSFNQVKVNGYIAVGDATRKYVSITDVMYDNNYAYTSHQWQTGFSSNLYSMSTSPLNLTALNNATDDFIIFHNYFIDESIYQIGTFINKDNENILYDTISIKGLLINGTSKFSQINVIRYNDVIVYQNGVWNQNYDADLQYFGFSDLNITQLNNDCNNIVVFTKSQFIGVNPQLHQDLLGGVSVLTLPLLTIIQASSTNFFFAVILILNIVSFVVAFVFYFVKKKE